MSENIIDVSNISKSFGGRKVVDGLSLSVAQGEVFGLLGHNGAGKSTTIEWNNVSYFSCFSRRNSHNSFWIPHGRKTLYLYRSMAFDPDFHVFHRTSGSRTVQNHKKLKCGHYHTLFPYAVPFRSYHPIRALS